jgi:VIT1/CCC1 family predicted Fe2+/Mn2+ transporter
VNWDTWSKIAIAVFGVTAAVLKIWESHRARTVRLSELKTMIDIVIALPEGNEAKDIVTKHIESQLKLFVKDEQVGHRDATGIFLGVAFLAGSAWLIYTALTATAWWWLLAVPVLSIGAVGLADGVTRRERGPQKGGSSRSTSVAMGLVFIIGGAWLIFNAFTVSGWWWYLAVPVVILGLASLGSALTRPKQERL